MEPSAEIALLLKGLRDRSVFLRQKAARGLGHAHLATLRGTPQAAPALASALGDSNKYVRAAAAFALARLAPERPTGVDALVQLLGDEHRDVRLSAASALGDLGRDAKAAVPALKALASDPHPPVRLQATEALQKIGE